MNVQKIFIEREKHQQTEFEVVINNVPMFITASGTAGSIQNAKGRIHIGTLCIAAFSYIVYESCGQMLLPPPAPKK
jgi:hypothetical protein